MCAVAAGGQQRYLAGVLSAAAQPPVYDSPDSVSLRSWLNPPWSCGVEEDIFKAANILGSFSRATRFGAWESGLPRHVLRGASALAILSVARVSAGWAFSAGTGLLVSRTGNGQWSAPCAVAAGGIGWGLQFGGELTDLLLVLHGSDALRTFCTAMQKSVVGGSVGLGGTAGLAIGPLGRQID
eukprot:CAMPEP_0175055360 /NCGR_PEP_ID=MMETSP0052_2-20121109/10033_1 /TAXON_ID=51329 ORGANISM="Polytomella parva, Strain SAG 63-3" /NCGR_SAMPLE_ID=MMETSP0052_2 /ASSEMBLY_ACC=CAM_ASM_000194 /LENGTH=182 /DNA_ID=CAMNT_0016320189 /DNA_START=805 /DNA_END=1350 /DNA_ORIENTATION=-